MNISSLPSRKFQLPSRKDRPQSSETPPDLSAAQVREKGSFGWAKAAAGLGLAAGALAGCTSPTPPAQDPGAYVLESPEIVVMSDSLHRIDLARETETVCTGFGEDERCDTEKVDYHPIGIHVGHGVVEDLNGNLFSAPQLVTGGPGIAVKNPDSVYLDGPLGSEGRLRRLDENTVETSKSLFGRHQITLTENEALVTGPSLFGSRHEEIRVRVNGGVATISEGRWDQQLVQSQGDHLLVQSARGNEIASVRNDNTQGSYSVSQPSLFSDYRVTVKSDSNSTRFEDNSWGRETVVTKGTNRQGQTTFETRSGGWRQGTTTVTDSGWKDQSAGLFGGSTVEYHITGGEYLPGR